MSSTTNVGAATGSGLEVPIDISTYTPIDDFFGAPYIDCDEERDAPVPHRYIHGGFEGTDTRFAFCFPPPDCIDGPAASSRSKAPTPATRTSTPARSAHDHGGLEMTFRLGGYMVESNMGHIGDVMDPKAGDDPTIYGWRAAAEIGRFSKFVAAQMLRAAPARTPTSTAAAAVRGGPRCAWPTRPTCGTRRCRSWATPTTATTATWQPHAQRHHELLRRCSTSSGCSANKIYDVVDAMWPGGSGDPFAGLDTHQREELADLLPPRLPPRRRVHDRPADGPDLAVVLDGRAAPTRVPRVLESVLDQARPRRLRPARSSSSRRSDRRAHDGQAGALRRRICSKTRVPARRSSTRPARSPALFAGMHNMWDVAAWPCELDDVPDGLPASAPACELIARRGRRSPAVLHSTATATCCFCDGEGEASNLRFTGVQPGDEVHVDNRRLPRLLLLLPPPPAAVESRVRLPARRRQCRSTRSTRLPEMSPFMGIAHTGRFEGKMLWVHHTHDCVAVAAAGHRASRPTSNARCGAEGGPRELPPALDRERRARAAGMAASPPGRANNTWLVDYQPDDRAVPGRPHRLGRAGRRPVGRRTSTTTTARSCCRSTPPSAAASSRSSPSPPTARTRAEVAVGEDVTLTVHAEVPRAPAPSSAWRGTSTDPAPSPSTSTARRHGDELTLTTTHSLHHAGTYFVTALVESHRDGDVEQQRRIPNVASAARRRQLSTLLGPRGTAGNSVGVTIVERGMRVVVVMASIVALSSACAPASERNAVQAVGTVPAMSTTGDRRHGRRRGSPRSPTPPARTAPPTQRSRPTSSIRRAANSCRRHGTAGRLGDPPPTCGVPVERLPGPRSKSNCSCTATGSSARRAPR